VIEKGVALLQSSARISLRKLSVGPIRTRVFATIAIMVFSVGLGGCSSFSGFVADNWPHWAGGMPKDVPPRPGAPGYGEFVAHGKAPDNTSTPEVKSEPVFVTRPATGEARAAPRPAAPQDTGDAVNGGLY
jgi:hypothetical protein